MAKIEAAGTARRSQLISTFGVGALLPIADDSVMIGGLDKNWRRGEIVEERRLAESLQVSEFRSPPARGKADIPVIRFPEWAFCPNSDCRALAPKGVLTDRGGKRCSKCSTVVSPSRFVVACEGGHIEDFPYRAWVHKDASVGFQGHDLRLRSQGKSSSLSDLVVECQCGGRRSLDGVFDPTVLRGIKSCKGNRPWLLDGAEPEECPRPLRTLQRGSSNVWFGVQRSAISIPSVREEALRYAKRLLSMSREDASAETIAASARVPEGLAENDIVAAINELRTRHGARSIPTDADLRADEYRALTAAAGDLGKRHTFHCEESDLTGSDVPEEIEQVCRVGRLREVRALQGFSRVSPYLGQTKDGSGPALVALSGEARPTWLPAIEVLGEGVFLRLNEEKLAKWESTSFARRRTARVQAALDGEGSNGLIATDIVLARDLLLHSLAHALINEFSLTAGYPAASIRERVYAIEGQAGILVYTATADGAGSLGGLAALSSGELFSNAFHSAIERARWCTSDPVCIETRESGVGGLNSAACHACLLVPETSCERFNLFLDRALLIGTPENPDAGFFSGVRIRL